MIKEKRLKYGTMYSALILIYFWNMVQCTLCWYLFTTEIWYNLRWVDTYLRLKYGTMYTALIFIYDWNMVQCTLRWYLFTAEIWYNVRCVDTYLRLKYGTMYSELILIYGCIILWFTLILFNITVFLRVSHVTSSLLGICLSLVAIYLYP
jgi:hypothetical protein